MELQGVCCDRCVFYHTETCTPHREQDHDGGSHCQFITKELCPDRTGVVTEGTFVSYKVSHQTREGTKPMTPLVRTNNGTFDKSP